MSTLFAILFFFSLIAFILGLIKPRLVIGRGEKRTRGKVALVYGILMVVFIALSGATNNSPSQPAAQTATAPPASNTSTSSTDSSNSSTSSDSSSTSNSASSAPAPAPASDSKQVVFVNSLAGVDPNGNVTIDPSSVSYVKQHPTWFPATSDSSYQSAVDHSLTIPMIMKDPTQYYTQLYQGTGTVVEIHQYSQPTTYAVIQVYIDNGPDAGSNAFIGYEGDTGSIVQNSEITFVGLPLAEYDFDNVSGGQTQSILFDGIHVAMAGTSGN